MWEMGGLGKRLSGSVRLIVDPYYIQPVSYASVETEEDQVGKKKSLTGAFVNITSSQQNPPPAGRRSLVSDNPSATTDPRQIGNNQYHGEVKGNETNEDTNIPAAVTIAIVILGVLKVTGSQSIDPSH